MLWLIFSPYADVCFEQLEIWGPPECVAVCVSVELIGNGRFIFEAGEPAYFGVRGTGYRIFSGERVLAFRAGKPFQAIHEALDKLDLFLSDRTQNSLANTISPCNS